MGLFGYFEAFSVSSGAEEFKSRRPHYLSNAKVSKNRANYLSMGFVLAVSLWVIHPAKAGHFDMPYGWGLYEFGMTTDQVIAASGGNLEFNSDGNLAGEAKVDGYPFILDLNFSGTPALLSQIMFEEDLVSGDCSQENSALITNLKAKFGDYTSNSDFMGTALTWRLKSGASVVALGVNDCGMKIAYNPSHAAVPDSNF